MREERRYVSTHGFLKQNYLSTYLQETLDVLFVTKLGTSLDGFNVAKLTVSKSKKRKTFE